MAWAAACANPENSSQRFSLWGMNNPTRDAARVGMIDVQQTINRIIIKRMPGFTLHSSVQRNSGLPPLHTDRVYAMTRCSHPQLAE